MQITKTAHADISAKLEPIDRIDYGNAFELGILKQAADLGLSEPQFAAVYEMALRQLAK